MNHFERTKAKGILRERCQLARLAQCTAIVVLLAIQTPPSW